MASSLLLKLLLPLSLVFVLLVGVNAQALKVGFYKKTCPHAESIILEEMKKVLLVAPSLAGPLLRLHFHDCFVNVCHYKSHYFTWHFLATYILNIRLLCAGMWCLDPTECHGKIPCREGCITESKPQGLWHDRPCQGQTRKGLPGNCVVCRCSGCSR